MGMSASQARFLGLTARKSNVEYQGQQVNQQRTVLANESSNLYSEMSNLKVPTPPSQSDYYKTSYTLDDSADGNCSNYTIENLTKVNNSSNEYKVKLKTIETSTSASTNTYEHTQTTRLLLDDGTTYKYTVALGGKYITYNPNSTPLNCNTTTGKVSFDNIEKNTIYSLDSTAGEGDNKKSVSDFLLNDEGYIAAEKLAEKDGTKIAYFYQNSSGKNVYLTEAQLKSLTSGLDYSKGDTVTPDAGTYAQIYVPTEQKTEKYADVLATLDSSSNGRYTNIHILDSDGTSDNLAGKDFSVSYTSEYDEESYTDAYNDYEYQLNVYDQAIEEINAKTKTIQNEDKKLELRLKQLDTEENALKTEMDAVKEVIKNNVESTFKTFNA